MPANNRELRRLRREIRRLKWFPSYQDFPELGIKGRRNDAGRYGCLDFSLCAGKVVADYGCNLGQAAVKAAKAGAAMVIGMDSQKDTIAVARKIRDLISLKNLEYHVVDFNEPVFESSIKGIFGGEVPHISFFLSVYRTKELRDRDGLLRFIADNTREMIFFEGHSDRRIDTIEYYEGVFAKFGFKAEFLGYGQGDTRPFFVIRLQR
jgi:SAM-dependent methyltransferase